MAWDFASAAWVASFVRGPHESTRKRIGIADISHVHWDTLRSAVAGDIGDYRSATILQKRAVAKALMIELCKAVVCGECEAFEDAMGLNVAAIVTPSPKKHKRRPSFELDDESAVAAPELADDMEDPSNDSSAECTD